MRPRGMTNEAYAGLLHSLEQRITDLATKTPGGGLVIADTDYYEAVNYGEDIKDLTDGREELVFDGLGRPNLMTNFWADEWSRLDFLSAGGTLFTPDKNTMHPAFYCDQDGNAPCEFQIGKYQAGRFEGKNTPCSLYNLVPSNSLSLDAMLSLINAMGGGFALTTQACWSYMALLSMRLSFECRGNSLYGKSHEASDEIGKNANIYSHDGKRDWYLSRTGTGPTYWNLLGDPAMPADLVGNVLERVADVKFVKGVWRIIPYNYGLNTGLDLSSTSVFFKELSPGNETAFVDPGTSGSLCYDLVSTAGSQMEISNAVVNGIADGVPSGGNMFASTKVHDGVIVPPYAYELLFAPVLKAPKGYFWFRWIDESTPFFGGSADYGSNAGLGYRTAHYGRGSADIGVGFRPSRLKKIT